MANLPTIKPMATMEAAWAKFDRLRSASARVVDKNNRLREKARRLRTERARLNTEYLRLYNESHMVVIRTAEKLRGEGASVNWDNRTVEVKEVWRAHEPSQAMRPPSSKGYGYNRP